VVQFSGKEERCRGKKVQGIPVERLLVLVWSRSTRHRERELSTNKRRDEGRGQHPGSNRKRKGKMSTLNKEQANNKNSLYRLNPHSEGRKRVRKGNYLYKEKDQWKQRLSHKGKRSLRGGA